MREKLVELLSKYFDIGDSYCYNLTRTKNAFACGTMGFDDFEEFDDETVADIADHLIANGVTFREDVHWATEQAYKNGYEAGYADGEIDFAPKWIPVTVRLPEIVSTHKHYRYTTRKSIRVLCVCVQKSGKTMVKEGYCELYNDYPEPRWQIPGTIDSVTHWMPLPEPPKGE